MYQKAWVGAAQGDAYPRFARAVGHLPEHPALAGPGGSLDDDHPGATRTQLQHRGIQRGELSVTAPQGWNPVRGVGPIH